MEKSQFKDIVAEFIAKECALMLADPLLVTVSGGADSVALLLVLRELGYSVVAAHCNFHLRGEESNRDERWVRTITTQLSVPLVVKHFDVEAYEREHGVSTEMACRELRYEWFYALAEQHQCQAIAVAHHVDDAVETFFMNAMRGSGVQGLASIKPRNGKLVRPLLCVTRSDVEQYLTDKGVLYVTDSTNLESVYKRNKLRNVVIPEIYSLFPESTTGLQRTLHDMRSSAALYAELIEQAGSSMVRRVGDVVIIDCTALTAMRSGEAMLYELIKEYGFNSTQAHEAFATIGRSGKRFCSSTHELVVGRDSMEICGLTEKAEEAMPVNIAHGVTSPVVISVVRNAMPFRREEVDGKRVVAFGESIMEAQAVLLRHPKRGDRFRPFGMKGTKLLSDLFNDCKLSEMEKRRVWVLEADGKIVWVLGMRAADAFSIADGDEYYYQLTYKEN